MIIKIDKLFRNKFEELLACILMFFTCLNFNNTYRAFSIILLVVCLLGFIKKRQIRVNFFDLFIVVFLLSYYFLDKSINDRNKIVSVITFFIFYIAGKYIISKYYDNNSENQISCYLLLSAAAGISIYATLTTFNSDFTITRICTLFWGTGTAPATQIAAWEILTISFIPWLIVSRKLISPWLMVGSIIIEIGAIASMFILSSRTGLIIIVFAFVWAFFSMVKYKKWRILWLTVGLLVFAIISYYLNLFGLKTIIGTSNLVLRLNSSGLSDVRATRHLYVLQNFIKYPNGGLHYNAHFGGQIHSMFLDLYDEVGIIPFILFFGLYLSIAIKIYKLIKAKAVSIETIIGISGFFILNSLQYFMEPVWDYNYPCYLAVLFLFMGVIDMTYMINSAGTRDNKS